MNQLSKRIKEQLEEGRQFRSAFSFAIEPATEKKRFDTNFYIEGYASTYEPYVLYDFKDRPIYEVFEKGCFDNADMSDVVLRYDHEGRVFARGSNNTLITEADNVGLFFAADLSLTQAAKEAHEDVDKGLVTKTSWAFLPGENHFDEETNTIVHTSIRKVYDVSLVSIPANNGTEVYARSFVDGVIEKAHRESVEREQMLHERNRLILLCKINSLSEEN